MTQQNGLIKKGSFKKESYIGGHFSDRGIFSGNVRAVSMISQVQRIDDSLRLIGQLIGNRSKVGLHSKETMENQHWRLVVVHIVTGHLEIGKGNGLRTELSTTK